MGAETPTQRIERLAYANTALTSAGKHLAVKLAEVYRAAGRSPAECQAIRDWMAALAAAEARS
jgi:hypothetical protein